MNTNPEIFRRNWEALQKHYPDLALVLGMVKIEKYELVQHENCIPNVLINGQPYYVGNVKDFCEKQFKGFKMENAKIPVFLGAGLFYEVMCWMQFLSPVHKSQSIIIIEKDLEMFMCAMNVSDLTQIIENPKIYLFVGIPPEQLYTTFRNFYMKHLPEMLMCGATQPVFCYPSMKIGKEYYMFALNTMFESIYHCIQNFGNCPEDSLIGLENMLDNVSEIVNNPGVNLLYDKFKGKPAVIIATGPSLRKNMHLLKGLYDKALIISVDASFKLLMRNGIKPHMVTSLEREHAVEQFFDNFDPDEVKNIYMTACPVLFNHVYQAYTGPQIIAYRNFDHFKWLEIDRGILDIKLSSSNMAFKIAEALGCDPIILVGQDLAYGPNNETHATEVPFSSEGEGIFHVPGNCQEQVKTNSGWYNFLKAYEMDISQHRGAVINCTEGGAYIPGTRIAPLADTIADFEPFNPMGIIKENLSTFASADSDTEKLKGIIEHTETEVSAIIDNCIAGVEAVKKHEEEIKTALIERLTAIRMEIITPRQEIQSKYADTFQRFLMHVIQGYHLKFEMEGAMIFTDPKELLVAFRNWYSFIGDIAQICLDSLQRAKVRLYGE